MQTLTLAMLEALVREKPAPPGPRRGGRALGPDGRQGFDLAAWIEEHQVPIRREGGWDTGGYRWVLEECPWNGHTDASAYIVRFNNGAIAAGCHHNSCQGYGWRDLREHYEPGCYDRERASTVHSEDAGSKAAIVELPPAPPFPLPALPSALRRIVEESAATIGCPPEFIAAPMLAMLGSAVGNTHVLELKKGWTEGAALFTAVVADPGSKKTPASKVATRPAWRRQAELKAEYDAAMAEYRRAREDEYEGEPSEEPVLHRTVIDDTTVEALVVRLAENPRGLLVARDELSGWARSMDQYRGGKGSDRQFYLSAWSGSPIVVDRKARREPLMIPRPFLGLTGSIQPGILSELRNYREDGLLDRFLFAYPDPVPSRWTDDEISGETLAGYHELYDRLYDLAMGVDENGEPAPERLRFTAEAKTIFVREADSLREEMEHPGFPDHLKGPWSKLEAYLARLSLILDLVRVAEQDPLMISIDDVQERDVKAAAELLRYFKAHARRAYAKLHGERPEYLLAEA